MASNEVLTVAAYRGGFETIQRTPSARQRVLVVNPPTINAVLWLKELQLDVQVVATTRGLFPQLRKHNIDVHWAPELSFLSGLNPQQYDVVFLPALHHHVNPIVLVALAKRACRWNGCVLATGDGLGGGAEIDAWTSPEQSQYVVHDDMNMPAVFMSWHKKPGWLLLGYRRAGLQMLTSGLVKHSYIRCFDEIANQYNLMQQRESQGSPFPTPRHLLEAHWEEPCCGFPLDMRTGIEPDTVSAELRPTFTTTNTLYKHIWTHVPTEVKAIRLTRNNLLARHVSHLQTSQAGNWNSYENPPDWFAPVHVDIPQLFADMEHVKKCVAFSRERYPNAIEVTYEALCGDWPGTLRAIQKFLGVPFQVLSPGTIKQGPPLHDAIMNRDEVANALKSEGLQSWLN